MAWDVEYTDEFEAWWSELADGVQDAIGAVVEVLIERGTNLRYPHSSGLVTSAHDHMRELWVQYRGHPYRILYAFDPRRTAILLIGGDKTGDARWYQRIIPIADRLYDVHLVTLKQEGLLDG